MPFCCGGAVATTVCYDASALTEMLGMSRHGDEGLVAFAGLVLSTVLFAVGTHAVTRRWVGCAARSAA